ncbi:serine hydrolase [candidate division WOR-3 bacterium]|uniref:Serine hydrolase n=1 Tax=candidate division WOR-3 bacterium TaxID=2052148 RepID=A0A9D5K7B8_UNCW3|nr:serine hydrolase [candidate division WOR-3 bacterium]MBD3363602.1 serine hydrolase [candidate division WOR-3 bacterium]
MRRLLKRHLFAGMILLSLPGCEEAWQVCKSYQDILNLAVKRGLPGAVMLVETPDSIWIGSAGLSNIEAETQIQASDRFRIASITKTFTAVLALQLLEEGTVTLDANLVDLLPDIADSIPYSSRITVHRLLNHTSGIYNYTDDNWLWHKALRDFSWQGGGPRELVKTAYSSRHKPYFEPGTGYHYSNTNYLLLQLILESVTDSAFSRLLRARIIEPLSLNNTYPERSGDTPEDFVTGYDIHWGQPYDVQDMSFARGMADGGLISNVFDVHTFSKALFSGRLFKHSSMLDTMLELNIKDNYGLGVVFLNDYGFKAWGHEGNWPGYLSLFYCWPEQGVTIVLMTNGTGVLQFKRVKKHTLRLLFEKTEF